MWSEMISGGEEVLAGKSGGLFWATSLEKIFGGVIAIISFRPGGWMQQVPCRDLLSFRSAARETSGSETPRVHHAARRRDGRSRRANWKHGHYSQEPRRNGRACGRQYLRCAICATR